MAISLKNLRKGGKPKPTIDLIYAPQGMGKTTLAAGAPAPVFLQTEDGLGVLEVDTFGLLKSYADVIAAIKELATQEHDFQTAVLDSAGWLEPLIWDETCRLNGWADIEAPGFGKGPVAAANVWRVVLDGLTFLRDHRNMGVIILAHSEIKRQEPPDGEDYDRYQPKLHARATAMLQEYADDVFFINTPVSITRSNAKDAKSRGIAVGGNQRFVFTDMKPTHMAKNRWTMPSMIPLPSPQKGTPPEPFTMFATVFQHVPYYRDLLNGAAAATESVANHASDAASFSAVANPFENLGEETEEAETEETTETNHTEQAQTENV